jgi:hypothetical protein
MVQGDASAGNIRDAFRSKLRGYRALSALTSALTRNSSNTLCEICRRTACPLLKRTLSHLRPSAPSKSGGWNYHLHCKRPQGSRQQLRPHPGPQAPRHPGPPPHPQRSRPQRSCQQRRPHPHCTSVILSMPAVAAAGSGRIGAAWVIPEPPAKTRPAIPMANSMRNICVHPIFPWLIRSSSRSLERRKATGQLQNGTSCSMPWVVQGGTVIAHTP